MGPIEVIDHVPRVQPDAGQHVRGQPVLEHEAHEREAGTRGHEAAHVAILDVP